MKVDEAKRLKVREQENVRLTRLLAGAELDRRSSRTQPRETSEPGAPSGCGRGSPPAASRGARAPRGPRARPAAGGSVLHGAGARRRRTLNTAVRVVCSNTRLLVLRNAEPDAIAARHTDSIYDRLADPQVVLGLSASELRRLQVRVNLLLEPKRAFTVTRSDRTRSPRGNARCALPTIDRGLFKILAEPLGRGRTLAPRQRAGSVTIGA